MQQQNKSHHEDAVETQQPATLNSSSSQNNYNNNNNHPRTQGGSSISHSDSHVAEGGVANSSEAVQNPLSLPPGSREKDIHDAEDDNDGTCFSTSAVPAEGLAPPRNLGILATPEEDSVSKMTGGASINTGAAATIDSQSADLNEDTITAGASTTASKPSPAEVVAHQSTTTSGTSIRAPIQVTSADETEQIIVTAIEEAKDAEKQRMKELRAIKKKGKRVSVNVDANGGDAAGNNEGSKSTATGGGKSSLIGFHTTDALFERHLAAALEASEIGQDGAGTEDEKQIVTRKAFHKFFRTERPLPPRSRITHEYTDPALEQLFVATTSSQSQYVCPFSVFMAICALQVVMSVIAFIIRRQFFLMRVLLMGGIIVHWLNLIILLVLYKYNQHLSRNREKAMEKATGQKTTISFSTVGVGFLFVTEKIGAWDVFYSHISGAFTQYYENEQCTNNPADFGYAHLADQPNRIYEVCSQHFDAIQFLSLACLLILQLRLKYAYALTTVNCFIIFILRPIYPTDTTLHLVLKVIFHFILWVFFCRYFWWLSLQKRVAFENWIMVKQRTLAATRARQNVEKLLLDTVTSPFLEKLQRHELPLEANPKRTLGLVRLNDYARWSEKLTPTLHIIILDRLISAFDDIVNETNSLLAAMDFRQQTTTGSERARKRRDGSRSVDDEEYDDGDDYEDDDLEDADNNPLGNRTSTGGKGSTEDLSRAFGVVKLKVFGDQYLIGSGTRDSSSFQVLRMVSLMKQEAFSLNMKLRDQRCAFSIQGSVHRGPCVCAFAGSSKLRYEVFGEALSTVQEMVKRCGGGGSSSKDQQHGIIISSTAQESIDAKKAQLTTKKIGVMEVAIGGRSATGGVSSDSAAQLKPSQQHRANRFPSVASTQSGEVTQVLNKEQTATPQPSTQMSGIIVLGQESTATTTPSELSTIPSASGSSSASVVFPPPVATTPLASIPSTLVFPPVGEEISLHHPVSQEEIVLYSVTSVSTNFNAVSLYGEELNSSNGAKSLSGENRRGENTSMGILVDSTGVVVLQGGPPSSMTIQSRSAGSERPSGGGDDGFEVDFFSADIFGENPRGVSDAVDPAEEDQDFDNPQMHLTEGTEQRAVEHYRATIVRRILRKNPEMFLTFNLSPPSSVKSRGGGVSVSSDPNASSSAVQCSQSHDGSPIGAGRKFDGDGASTSGSMMGASDLSAAQKAAQTGGGGVNWSASADLDTPTPPGTIVEGEATATLNSNAMDNQLLSILIGEGAEASTTEQQKTDTLVHSSISHHHQSRQTVFGFNQSADLSKGFHEDEKGFVGSMFITVPRFSNSYLQDTYERFMHRQVSLMVHHVNSFAAWVLSVFFIIVLLMDGYNAPSLLLSLLSFLLCTGFLIYHRRSSRAALAATEGKNDPSGSNTSSSGSIAEGSFVDSAFGYSEHMNSEMASVDGSIRKETFGLFIFVAVPPALTFSAHIIAPPTVANGELIYFGLFTMLSTIDLQPALPFSVTIIQTLFIALASILGTAVRVKALQPSVIAFNVISATLVIYGAHVARKRHWMDFRNQVISRAMLTAASNELIVEQHLLKMLLPSVVVTELQEKTFGKRAPIVQFLGDVCVAHIRFNNLVARFGDLRDLHHQRQPQQMSSTAPSTSGSYPASGRSGGASYAPTSATTGSRVEYRFALIEAFTDYLEELIDRMQRAILEKIGRPDLIGMNFVQTVSSIGDTLIIAGPLLRKETPKLPSKSTKSSVAPFREKLLADPARGPPAATTTPRNKNVPGNGNNKNKSNPSRENKDLNPNEVKVEDHKAGIDMTVATECLLRIVLDLHSKFIRGNLPLLNHQHQQQLLQQSSGGASILGAVVSASSHSNSSTEATPATGGGSSHHLLSSSNNGTLKSGGQGAGSVSTTAADQLSPRSIFEGISISAVLHIGSGFASVLGKTRPTFDLVGAVSRTSEALMESITSKGAPWNAHHPLSTSSLNINGNPSQAVSAKNASSLSNISSSSRPQLKIPGPPLGGIFITEPFERAALTFESPTMKKIVSDQDEAAQQQEGERGGDGGGGQRNNASSTSQSRSWRVKGGGQIRVRTVAKEFLIK